MQGACQAPRGNYKNVESYIQPTAYVDLQAGNLYTTGSVQIYKPCKNRLAGSDGVVFALGDAHKSLCCLLRAGVMASSKWPFRHADAARPCTGIICAPTKCLNARYQFASHAAR